MNTAAALLDRGMHKEKGKLEDYEADSYGRFAYWKTSS